MKKRNIFIGFISKSSVEISDPGCATLMEEVNLWIMTPREWEAIE